MDIKYRSLCCTGHWLILNIKIIFDGAVIVANIFLLHLKCRHLQNKNSTTGMIWAFIVSGWEWRDGWDGIWIWWLHSELENDTARFKIAVYLPAGSPSPLWEPGGQTWWEGKVKTARWSQHITLLTSEVTSCLDSTVFRIDRLMGQLDLD